MTALTARIRAFRLPLVTPVVTGRTEISVRRGLLISLDDGGHVGWGEASPLPGWPDASLVVTERALRSAAATIRSDADVPGVLETLESLGSARAAVAGAWADLSARRAGCSLARHLAADAAPDVAVNVVMSETDPDRVEAAAASAIRSGYRAVKLKVGAVDPDLDVDRVRSARRGAPDVGLRLDANQAWDLDTALDVLGRVATEEISWCEEPTARLDDLVEIERSSAVAVAVDESAATEAGLRRALELGVSVVVVKPQAIGGPDRTAARARRIHASGAQLVVTSFMDSAVGVAHALHSAAAFGSPVAHGLATAGLLAEDVTPAPPVVAGRMRVDGIGLGLDPSG